VAQLSQVALLVRAWQRLNEAMRSDCRAQMRARALRVTEVLLSYPTRDPADEWAEIADESMEAAAHLLDRTLDRQPILAELADLTYLSPPRQFTRRFAAMFGKSPASYSNHRRLEHVKELILSGGHTLTQISQLMGFSSVHSFSRWFHRLEGPTPSAFRGDIVR
jgi:transcriptional regulator GlxA family with amidase domain